MEENVIIQNDKIDLQFEEQQRKNVIHFAFWGVTPGQSLGVESIGWNMGSG